MGAWVFKIPSNAKKKNITTIVFLIPLRPVCNSLNPQTVNIIKNNNQHIRIISLYTRQKAPRP